MQETTTTDRSSSLQPPGDILRHLESDDPDDLKPLLTLLCPCRNLHYNPDVWMRMAEIAFRHPDWYTREAALHAIVTLKERSRFDRRAVDLLDELARRGCQNGMLQPRWLVLERERQGTWAEPRYPKVARRDVPTLLESLASEDPVLQQDAFRALCPGRSRRYNARVWKAILDAGKDPNPTTRSVARTAWQRLSEQAQSDPLAAQMVARLRSKSG